MSELEQARLGLEQELEEVLKSWAVLDVRVYCSSAL